LGDSRLDSTSTNLLRRVVDREDREAWAEFAQKYAPVIHGWCKRHGSQEADAEDVTQDVLLRLFRLIQSYDRSRGRFTPWLKTVTENAWRDFTRAHARQMQAKGDSEHLAWINQVPDDDLAMEIVRRNDMEVAELAEQRVRAMRKERDWEIFRCLTIERMPGAEVAARYGMSLSAIRVVNYRVKKDLKAIIQEIEDA